ncbi:hypothetical protein BGZ65_004703 [Modicella reniformis]|uniref:Uncharacterized protein n=1 Tax=Modicella reniformis TaxID=1440133 RepID=A0A9P6SLJ4_9FUNG|nr:hypothetical protein BGZ65_004703 [Modicella reniformis]
MKNVPIEDSKSEYASLRINPKNTTMVDGFLNYTAYIFIIPSQGNLFASNGGLWPSDGPDLPDGTVEYFSITQGQMDMRIDVFSKVTKVIRKDFLGFFGLHDNNLKQEFASSERTYNRSISNTSIIEVQLKKYSMDQTEILLTSIPDAIAAFGGAFSAAWGLFHFFFGAGRLDPFGMISKRFLRKKTQKRLAESYGYWPLQSVTSESPEKAPNNASVNEPAHDPPDSASDMWTQENTKQIQEQVKHQRKVEKDLEKLEGFLREYYLDMAIASVDNPATNGDSGRWHRWIWPFKSRNSHGGDNP